MNAKRLRSFVIDLLVDLIAGIFYALGIYTFAKPANFAPGGLSGLALIAHHLWNWPIGVTTLVLNIPLVLLSFRFVGGGFLIKTLRSMIICTLYVDVVFPHLPLYTGSPFLAALFSGATLGIALALFYMRGSSSGGADLLSMIIKVLRPHLSLGMLTLATDVVIILLGWPVFGNVDSVLYGLSSVALSSVVIDKIMYGAGSSKLVIIITDRGREVADRIMSESERGATLIRATGAYTNAEKQVLLCACARAEAYQVRSCAHAADPASFVMITDTGEVYGEGFSDPKNPTSFI